MSLKQKTISGVFWSFAENSAQNGIAFVIGIILARMLSPKEFGLIGLLTVFTAIAQTFTDSGFKNAIIRKKNCTDVDLSTVFYFNIAISLIFYFAIFVIAPLVANFYDEPQLVNILRVVALSVIIEAFTLVQRAVLTKRVDFKLQTRISVIAAICSGSVGIAMAYMGYGVWSLVARNLIQFALNSVMLWMWNQWRPILAFSLDSFRQMFSFGSKLLAASIISVIWSNIYDLMIGKIYSVEALGLFHRARAFERLPSHSIQTNIARVSYPVLAQLNDNDLSLKRAYKKLITTTTLVTFVLMLGLAAVSEPLVLVLVGEKWRQSILYLQMLCLVGMMYPLHSLNLNMLLVKGRSGLYLKLEIYKKFFSVPILLLGYFFSLEIMLVGMIVNTQLMYLVNSYWSGKLIDYSVREQIMDILPGFMLAALMAIAVFLIGYSVPMGYLLRLIVQLAFGGLITLFLCERTRMPPYLYLKEIALGKFAQITGRLTGATTKH